VNRRGTVRDLITAAIGFLIIVVAWISATMLLDAVAGTSTAFTTGTAGEVLSSAQSAFHIMDYGIVIVLGAIYLSAVVFALRIPSQPIYVIPSLILVVVSGFVSAEFSNVLWKFVGAAPEVTAAANQYPVMLEVVKLFPLIQVSVGFLIIVALYTKRPQTDGVNRV